MNDNILFQFLFILFVLLNIPKMFDFLIRGMFNDEKKAKIIGLIWFILILAALLFCMLWFR